MTKGPEKGTVRRPWALGDNQSQWMRYLLLLLAVGVVLMSVSNKAVRDVDADGVSVTTEQPVTDEEGTGTDYARALERLIQDALMQLHGVQRVHVAVTLAGGPRKVLAETVTTERRMNEPSGGGSGTTGSVIDERSSREPVLVRNDQVRQESPIVLVEQMPAIEGVVIVTDAASDSRLRLEIARAVATLLGVASHRVYVLPQHLD